ncbi:MAG: tetratricopeptide repeat protein [Chitinivibrionales bacterium]|nr:tetratricopeptide repeat protein [Chitinivibrionales bacterium]
MQLRPILSFTVLLTATTGLGLIGCSSDDALPRYRGASDGELLLKADTTDIPSPQGLAERIVLVAKGVREQLGDSALADPVEGMRAIDTLVLRLSSRLFMVNEPDSLVAELKELVFDESGIAFDRDQDELPNMFPHSVVARGRGSCLGMSLLLLVIGEKMDMPLHGVLAPEHFFVRFDDGSRSFNIETIKQGACFGDDWYRERYGIGEASPLYGLRSLGPDEVVGVLQFNVGNVYRERADYGPAVKCYEQTVAALPHFAEAWGNLGVALEALGEDERALEALERARELDPSLKNLQRNIGALQVRLARHLRAIEEYRQALTETPGDADLHYGLAFASYGAGEYEQACRHAREALEIRDTFNDARELLQRSEARLKDTQSDS